LKNDIPVSVPINGILDLHAFQPKEVKSLLLEYLTECQKQNILDVRIIHGKGIGALRETVHAQLKKYAFVKYFHLANELQGGWGATIVKLEPLM